MHHNLWLVEHNGGGLVTIVIRYTPLQVEMALVVLAGNTGSNLIGCRFPGLQSASFSACSQLNKEGLVSTSFHRQKLPHQAKMQTTSVAHSLSQCMIHSVAIVVLSLVFQ